VARLAGVGNAPPLLLYGHVDVVTTQRQTWQRPPFGSEVADGYIWGRGALDMKGGVAMLLAAFLQAQVAGFTPPGDVLLAIAVDEENGGDFGAKWLVEEHEEQFQEVHFALGEFGGFTLHVAGRVFYPIMVAEKQMCQVRATVRGPGSLPPRGGRWPAWGGCWSG
jgi:acetylornithine deacetylase/succinyl-diaminopimelate desuccinylase-like protein